jgi:hypothetical protein
VKEEVPGSNLAGGNMWCIMSLAMRDGGLVKQNFNF